MFPLIIAMMAYAEPAPPGPERADTLAGNVSDGINALYAVAESGETDVAALVALEKSLQYMQKEAGAPIGDALLRDLQKLIAATEAKEDTKDAASAVLQELMVELSPTK